MAPPSCWYTCALVAIVVIYCCCQCLPRDLPGRLVLLVPRVLAAERFPRVFSISPSMNLINLLPRRPFLYSPPSVAFLVAQMTTTQASTKQKPEGQESHGSAIHTGKDTKKIEKY